MKESSPTYIQQPFPAKDFEDITQVPNSNPPVDVEIEKNGTTPKGQRSLLTELEIIKLRKEFENRSTRRELLEHAALAGFFAAIGGLAYLGHRYHDRLQSKEGVIETDAILIGSIAIEDLENTKVISEDPNKNFPLFESIMPKHIAWLDQAKKVGNETLSGAQSIVFINPLINKGNFDIQEGEEESYWIKIKRASIRDATSIDVNVRITKEQIDQNGYLVTEKELEDRGDVLFFTRGRQTHVIEKDNIGLVIPIFEEQVE